MAFTPAPQAAQGMAPQAGGNRPQQVGNLATGQTGYINQYSGRFMPQGMSMQQAMAQRGMQMPTRPSQQQFAPQPGQPPLPNPTAAPPMLQPAGMSQIGPQQGPQAVSQPALLMSQPAPLISNPSAGMSQIGPPMMASDPRAQLALSQGPDPTGMRPSNPESFWSGPVRPSTPLSPEQQQSQEQAMMQAKMQADLAQQGMGQMAAPFLQQGLAGAVMGQSAPTQTNPYMRDQMPSYNPMGSQQTMPYGMPPSPQTSLPTTGTMTAPNGRTFNTNPTANAFMAGAANAAKTGYNGLTGNAAAQAWMKANPMGSVPLPQKAAKGGPAKMGPRSAWRPAPSILQPLQMQPPMGQPPMGQPPMGQPPMGQPPMGQPPMGQPQMGQPPMQPPMGQPAPQGFARGGKVIGHKDDSSSPVDDQMMALLHQNPQFTQAIDQADQEFEDMPISAINEFIRMIRLMIKNPKNYTKIRQAAIQDGMIDPEDIPVKFDTNFLGSMLATLVALKKKKEGKAFSGNGQMMQQNAQGHFAKGGLSQAAQLLQSKGRNGDTILAHINPQEAAMLRAHGGSGTINPHTGLVEYGWLKKLWNGIKSVAKVVLPIVLTAFVPAAGAFLGSFMAGTIGATAAGIIGTSIAGAASGALGAAISGGDIGKGAIFGGITGGLTNTLGQVANTAGKALGLTKGLSATAQGLWGASLAGAGAAAATGEDWKTGAVKGLAQRYLSDKLQNFEPVKKGTEWLQNKSSELLAPDSQAPNAIADAKTQGVWDPEKQQWMEYKPNIEAAPGHVSPDMIPGSTAAPDATGAGRYVPMANQAPPPAGSAAAAATASTSAAPVTAAGTAPTAPPADQGFLSKAWDYTAGALGKAAVPLAITAASGGLDFGDDTPPEAIQAINSLSPENQEYFNRKLRRVDYGSMKRIADAQGMTLADWMNQNIEQIRGGAYDMPEAGSTPTTPKARGGMAYATGGALSKVAYLAEGSGSGRADTIDAKLSDGEYVIDAETVALLGDGSTKEGARRLDMMRQQLRRQKGKVLAKGKFSPAAKSPLAYLAGAR